MLLRSFLHGICLSTDDSTISNWKPSPHYLSFFLMRFVFFFLIIFQFTNACEKLDCNLMFSILNFDGRLNEMQFSFSISFYLNRIREIRFFGHYHEATFVFQRLALSACYVLKSTMYIGTYWTFRLSYLINDHTSWEIHFAFIREGLVLESLNCIDIFNWSSWEIVWEIYQ